MSFLWPVYQRVPINAHTFPDWLWTITLKHQLRPLPGHPLSGKLPDLLAFFSNRRTLYIGS